MDEKKRRKQKEKDKKTATVNTGIPHDLEVGKMPREDSTETSSTSATDTSHGCF
jgi:hypothetical protein